MDSGLLKPQDFDQKDDQQTNNYEFGNFVDWQDDQRIKGQQNIFLGFRKSVWQPKVSLKLNGELKI